MVGSGMVLLEASLKEEGSGVDPKNQLFSRPSNNAFTERWSGSAGDGHIRRSPEAMWEAQSDYCLSSSVTSLY